MSDPEIIREVVSETLIEASCVLSKERVVAYQNAIEREDNASARWVLKMIIENAKLAGKNLIPLCNDTGIPHLFVEIGKDVSVNGNFFNIIAEGVRLGLQRLPGRPMAVKGNDLERIGQNRGLYKDPGMLLPAPIQTRIISEKKIRVTVMMLGGGPDIRARTYRVFHRRKWTNLIDEVAKWVGDEVRLLGCTPAIPTIGIGRTHYEATCLMLEAMKEGNFLEQSPLEKRVTDIVNKTKVGPLGLGGRTTALASFVKVGPLRAGGIRSVSMRLGCCWEPRRATREIPL
jgi:fumarate hydratase subunit alpha